MSLAKQLSGLSLGRSQLQVSLNNNINQVRFATKRAAGSKTNKNDSAGRRLGPKAYEGHFVKTGQIIMRQRGTKIHPGENVDIGKDHTIFAKEPGFVRFYYDPFHPLRKFVGVALKKELSLPTPHFEPRIRRFGYEEILDPVEAKREEEHMSRVEYLQQPELKETKRRRKEKIAESLAKYGSALNEFNLGLSEDESKLAQERLLSIAQLVRVGQSVEEAGIQASYNHLYDLKLSLQRSDITSEEHDTSRQKYLDFVSSFDKKISLDADLNACKYISPEDKIKQQQEIQSQLKNYFNKLITKEDKAKITELIKTPGVFTKSEQHDLFDTYLPKVLPDSVPGATVEIKDAKKAPKGVIIRKIFNEETKTVDLVGKPKEAFLA